MNGLIIITSLISQASHSHYLSLITMLAASFHEAFSGSDSFRDPSGSDISALLPQAPRMLLQEAVDLILPHHFPLLLDLQMLPR